MKRAVLLLLVCVPFPALAQGVIHRCVGEDGGSIFTDQTCAALGATSIAPPSTTAVAPTTGMLCARDLADLREGVARAFAAHDANRLGALILWNGYRSAGAVDDIRRMDTLVRQPLLSLSGDEATGLDAVMGRIGQSRQAHFAVTRESGCLWLRPAS